MTNQPDTTYLNMELLRFTTAGSVDDGKSTLIGRLLYDSKSIFEDQLEAVQKASIQKGNEYINLALFTDGLRSERQQGITIDVAYRYFHTPRRKFIIADTPGHIQYTRNMVTGASTAQAALILVDARNGVTEQTRRHFYIASLLGISNIIVCINKMDLVGYSRDVFLDIRNHLGSLAEKLPPVKSRYIPISALQGDNVVDPSVHMPWYREGTLLEVLETLEVLNHLHLEPLRLPVQYVIRPMSDQYHDFRGYAGRIASGTLHSGEEVVIMPSGHRTLITSIHLGDQPLTTATAPLSVTITLRDDLDVERGDFIVKPDNLPVRSNQAEAMICWMNPVGMNMQRHYILRTSTQESKCRIIGCSYKVDVNSLEHIPCTPAFEMNEIGCFSMKTARPLVYDSYATNRSTGSFILIDEATNETVGVGMIL